VCQRALWQGGDTDLKVLVTGGCGYIGSVVSWELLKAGHDVIVYDSLITGHRAAAPEQAGFVHSDLADPDVLEKTFARGDFDAVMHFAAFIQAGESMEKPALYFQNNVCNSLRLIEKAVEHRVERFVFSSTAAVYGEPRGELINEDDLLAPANAYGETKLMIERILHWFGEIHGLRWAALRYFNAAGAADGRGEAHEPETHLIPLALQVALGKRDSIRIFGTDYPTPDGTCVRDYVHVVDLASAHLLALEALGEKPHLTYNLGNGRGFSVREVIDVVREVTGHPIPELEAPRRPGDAPMLVAGSERIREGLGWRPKHPALEDIVQSAWKWHRTHPDGYEDAGPPANA
jgi:UDP-glucose 4-epimerase